MRAVTSAVRAAVTTISPPAAAAGQWRPRAAVLGRTIAFWMLYFVAARALFYGWHWSLVPRPDRVEVAKSFVHGLRMDASAAAYLATIPWLILMLTVAAPARLTRRLLHRVGVASVALISVITMTDIGTFEPWRHRVDGSLFTYLRTPTEAYASAASVSLGALVVMLVVVFVLGVAGFRLMTRRWTEALAAERGARAARSAAALCATGLLLVIPIRGGVQWTPLNESTVFFSRSEIANQGAQNAGWYLLYSTLAQQKEPTSNPYLVLPVDEARSIVDSLYAGAGEDAVSLLRMPRPNVILIIWESFTAKVVARLGGLPDATPHFDRWSHQGVLFDSLFASGERSAQGLVSILSGFPSVPNEAIMTRPLKAAALPQLGRTIRNAGYHTSYYYGGELAFANMKAYLLHGGFDRVSGVEDYRRDERNSKWGAHDHVVLSHALRDIQRESRPFFTTVFTLSSHEPFEVPVPPTFAGTDLSTQFVNAHHYTDASIGQFLDAASRQPWWDSTLVMIVADHGSPLPAAVDGAPESVVNRHRIPMLWVGGALRVRDTVVHRIAASTDLAPTLLAQLGIPPAGFRWGRNLLTTRDGAFAYFAHNDGFAYIDRSGWLVHDERGQRTLEQSGGAGAPQRRGGSALLQASFADYLAR